MKNLYLLLILSCSFFALSQDITITHEQNPGACDASVYVDTASINMQHPYAWFACGPDSSFNVQTPLATNDSLWFQCPGIYVLQYFDSLYQISTDTLYYFFTINPAIDCSYLSLSATVENETIYGLCDGTATAIPSGAASVSYSWSTGESTSSITDLCSGSYWVAIVDSQNCQVSANFAVWPDSVNYLNASIASTQETTNGACDGTVFVEIISGTPPYTFEHSSGGTTEFEENLCAGIYTVLVTDSAEDTLLITYIITNPATTFDTYNYIDSTVVDSLLSYPVENCVIDYSTIDTAYISSFEDFGDSVLITWTVNSSVGPVEIIQTYTGLDSSGVYAFVLDIYCPQKSVPQYFKLIDRYFYQNTTASLASNNQFIDLIVLPNPASTELRVVLPEGEVINELRVVDGLGKRFEVSWLGSTVQIASLSSGSYFLQFDTNNQSYTIRFMKN